MKPTDRSELRVFLLSLLYTTKISEETKKSIKEIKIPENTTDLYDVAIKDKFLKNSYLKIQEISDEIAEKRIKETTYEKISEFDKATETKDLIKIAKEILESPDPLLSAKHKLKSYYDDFIAPNN